MNWFTDRLPATRGDIRSLWDYALAQTEHITRIGERTMAKVDELRDRLAAATDELASDLEDLRARLAEQDAALAAELEPMVARLEAMGADPADPVPDIPPLPAPPAPQDITNPTPGAQDNPNG